MSDRSESAPAAGKAGSREKSVLGTVETLFKVAAASVGMVAAMGYPAVYLQLASFGVPSTFASPEMVLRAGAFPALVLAALFFYVYRAIGEYRGSLEPGLTLAVFFPALPFLWVPIAHILLRVGLRRFERNRVRQVAAFLVPAGLLVVHLWVWGDVVLGLPLLILAIVPGVLYGMIFRMPRLAARR